MSYTNNTVITGKTTDHALHLILSIITCGMWVPVWIIFAVVGALRKPKVVTSVGATQAPSSNQGAVISPDGRYVWNAQAQEWRLRD